MKHRDQMSTDLLPNFADGSTFPKKVDWQKWENENVEKIHFLKPKVIDKKHKPCVCLDTNVVIELTTLYFEYDSGFREVRSPKNLKSIKKLQKLIEQDKITVVVTPYVLQELYLGVAKYGKNCLRYIKENNIYLLDIPKNKDVYYFEAVENTALRYCGRCKSPYAPHARHGKKVEDKIFPLAYEYRIKRPDIDARIMAEASLLGGVLLTQNFEHFLADDKDKNIARINKTIKLGDEIMPYRPSVFLTLLELGREFPASKGQYKKYLTQSSKMEL